MKAIHSCRSEKLRKFSDLSYTFLGINSNIIPDISFNYRLKILDFRKQPPEMFYKKGVLRNFTKFTGKHLWQSLFFNKVADQHPCRSVISINLLCNFIEITLRHGWRSANLLKKRLWQRCFPVYFVKFSRTYFLQNTSGQLLLNFWKLWNVKSSNCCEFVH